MTTVSPKKSHDPARVNEISEKLMENPELASLISELSASADDASDLVKGLLQASINAGLQAEIDAHLGYSHSDRKAKAQVETAQANNLRNGSYTKTVNSGYGAVEVTVPRDRAEGSCRHVYSPDGAQGRTPAHRTRRHDRLAIRRRDDSARYPASPRDHARGGYEPGYDQHHYRCGVRRGHDLAKPPARRVLPGDLPRRATRENP